MRKVVLPLAFVFLCSILVWPQAQTRIKLLPDEEKYGTVGLLGGFYFLQDATFLELYGKSVPFFGAEMTLRFPFQDPHGLQIALSGRLLKKNGRTSYTEEDLRLRMTKLSLSICYSYDTGNYAFFIGPGVEYIMYKEAYAETFPIESTSGGETGLHLTAGGYVHLSSVLSLKGYVKYCAVDTDAPGFRVNLGGTEWGVSIAYRFYL